MHVQDLRNGLCALVVLTGLFVADTAYAESPNDIVVIVNKNLPVNETSVDELRQIFLKRKTSWKGGNNIVCINAQRTDPLRELFREKVLEMSNSEESEYWQKEKVRKQLSAPAEMGNAAKVVFKVKNAVAYAYRKDVPQGVVKIILVIPE